MNYDSHTTLMAIDEALNTNAFRIFLPNHKQTILKFIKYNHISTKDIMKILSLVTNILKQIALVSNLNEYEIKVCLYEKKLLLKGGEDVEIIKLN